ncbi:MAG: DUF86 domain-containing protein [Armatimonadota bacterium]|nr:DUF86 domain-containing protein [Armatimonadota bacterium]MDR7550189.1 DUF86 domain-containing protein [Armatimonadota bacterium]
MPIDREVLVRKSTLIAEDLVRLRSFAHLPVEDYLSRLDAHLATERLLERMIGRMLNVNYHIAVELGGVAPKDFFESFLKMAELGVLPPEFPRRIARAAGLRNRLPRAPIQTPTESWPSDRGPTPVSGGADGRSGREEAKPPASIDSGLAHPYDRGAGGRIRWRVRRAETVWKRRFSG